MKNKERYQSEKTKKLRKINKKLFIKSNLMYWIVGLLMTTGITVIMKGILNASTLLTIGIGSVVVAGFGCVIDTIFKENYYKNQKLIDKINVQEEVNKLNEEEKELVKEISKDEELIDAIDYISDLEFNEERAELLKNAVLNKNVLNTMQVLDDKKCIEVLPKYDFDSVNLEKEYQNAIEIGTKPKSLKKIMHEIKNSCRKEK